MTKDRNVENHISFQQMYEWMVFGLNKDEIDQFGEKRRGFKLPYRES